MKYDLMQTKNIMLVRQMFLSRCCFLTVKYVHVNIGAYRLLRRYSALLFLCLPTNRPPSQTCLATTSVRVLVTIMFWVFFFLRLIVLLREKRYCREQIGRNNRIKQQLLVRNVFSSPELSSISGQLMITTDW